MTRTVSLQAAAQYFKHSVRERGDRYFAEGRVREVEQIEGRLYVRVRGSRDYQVELVVEPKAKLGASCECVYFEDSGLCKHVWAAVRHAAEYGFLDEPIRSIHAHDSPGTDATLTGEPAPVRVSSWRKFLQALPPTAPATVPAQPRAAEELIYAVQVYGATRVQQSMHLVIRSRVRKKDGEWSKPRGIDITPATRRRLPEEDREIIGLLNATGYSDVHYARDYHIRPAAMAPFLTRMAATGRLFIERERTLHGPIEVDRSPAWRLEVGIERDPAGYRISGAFVRGDQERPLADAQLVFDGIVLIDGRLAPLEDTDALSWIDPLAQSGPVLIPEAERLAFFREADSLPASVRMPDDINNVYVRPEPVPVLRIARGAPYGELAATASFDYLKHEIREQDKRDSWIDGDRIVVRNRQAEQARISRLRSLPLYPEYRGGFTLQPAVLERVVTALVEEGWKVIVDDHPVRLPGEIESEIASGIDWFELRGGVGYGEVQVALPELLAALEQHRSTIALPDGSLGVVRSEWAERFADLSSLGEATRTGVRFRKTQGFLLDALLASRGTVRGDATFVRLRDSLTRAGRPQALEESPTFLGTLRPYQREGLGWMTYLGESGIGGCLADDMGLGKTVQVLALFDKSAHDQRRTSLVVAPRSLLFNWKQEAARFTPHLRVLEHHGPDRATDAAAFSGYDLILTTYATMRIDVELFAAAEFHYVVLDEAQAIKNSSSQIAKATRLLRATHRLALSGTPIENHLGELWSLVEFLNPGMLGSARWFSRTFAGRNVPAEKRSVLARAMRPLILRRTKEQVAPELPQRTEQTLYCELEGAQKKQYEELRDHYRASLLGQIEKKGIARSKMHILEALLRLRQAACHPALLGGTSDQPSAKFELLMQELAEIIESGHRALVFSQFTSLLALLREALDKERFVYSYLDGKTRNRATVVEEFQKEDGPPLFLISLKAGGVGLNLTEADYVFLLDPWWNPAVEAQAIDRTHRIGQTKPVVAYKMIARDTVEERILELQARKRALTGEILTDDNSVLRTLDAEDLERMLS